MPGIGPSASSAPTARPRPWKGDEGPWSRATRPSGTRRLVEDTGSILDHLNSAVEGVARDHV
jgi:hypothetical protein